MQEEDRALRTRFVELLIKSGGGDGGGGSNGRGTGKAKKSAGGSKKASKSAAAAAAATASSIGVLQPVAKLKRMKIGDDDVAKVVPERIFSLAIHPTEDKTLVLAGDKWGVVGVWEKESRRPEDAIVRCDCHLIAPFDCSPPPPPPDAPTHQPNPVLTRCPGYAATLQTGTLQAAHKASLNHHHPSVQPEPGLHQLV